MSCRSCGVVRDQAGKSGARRLDRGVGLRGVGLRILADDVVGVGRIDVARDGRAVDPFAGDVVLVCRGHVLPPVVNSGFERGLRAQAGQIKPRRARLRIRALVAEGPALAFVARAHPIDEPAELVGVAIVDDVARLVGEAHAGSAAVGDRREHRAEQKDAARRDRRGSRRSSAPTRSAGIAADLAPSTSRLRARKPSSPSTVSEISRRAHVVEREGRVEEAQEGPERAAGVLVLGLAEQERRPPLEIAQIDVIGERRADDRPARGDRERDFRLGVVPVRSGVEAGVVAGADRRHRLALGEDLGVGADADFKILRPRAGLDQRVLEPHGGGRAGLEAAEVLAEQRAISVARCQPRPPGCPARVPRSPVRAATGRRSRPPP